MKSRDYEMSGSRVEPRMRLLLLSVLVLCAACVNPGHPPEPEPGPESLAYWQERVRQLQPGMTVAEVRALLPEFEHGGGSGGAGGGSGYVLVYSLSKEWFVQVPFQYGASRPSGSGPSSSDDDFLMAGGSVSVSSNAERGESWRWPIPDPSR